MVGSNEASSDDDRRCKKCASYVRTEAVCGCGHIENVVTFLLALSNFTVERGICVACVYSRV